MNESVLAENALGFCRTVADGTVCVAELAFMSVGVAEVGGGAQEEAGRVEQEGTLGSASLALGAV